MIDSQRYRLGKIIMNHKNFRWMWSLLFLLPISISAADLQNDSTYVYCIDKNNPANWYWLDGDNAQTVQVRGNWKRKRVYINRHKLNVFVMIFDLAKGEEDKLVCESGYLAQPANYATDGWYLFRSRMLNGEHCLWNGYISLYKEVSRYNSYHRVRGPERADLGFRLENRPFRLMFDVCES